MRPVVINPVLFAKDQCKQDKLLARIRDAIGNQLHWRNMDRNQATLEFSVQHLKDCPRDSAFRDMYLTSPSVGVRCNMCAVPIGEFGGLLGE